MGAFGVSLAAWVGIEWAITYRLWIPKSARHTTTKPSDNATDQPSGNATGQQSGNATVPKNRSEPNVATENLHRAAREARLQAETGTPANGTATGISDPTLKPVRRRLRGGSDQMHSQSNHGRMPLQVPLQTHSRTHPNPLPVLKSPRQHANGVHGGGRRTPYIPSPRMYLSSDESMGFSSDEDALSSGDFNFVGRGW